MKHAEGAGFCVSTSDAHEHNYYMYFLKRSLLVERRRVCSYIEYFALNLLKAQHFSIIGHR